MAIGMETSEHVPSGKTVQIYIVSANDAGQAAPSETVQLVVP